MSSPSTAVETRKLPLYAAMVEAIRQEMTRDPTVFCMGEDVGQMGGVFFAHTPGLKVVVPSNAYDAKGLMTTAIRDDSPVVYLFHRGLLGLPVMGYVESAFATEVPEESYAIAFGQARVVREGADVTIVAFAQMVHKAVVAARELEAKAGARLRGPPHRIRARTGSHVRRLRARGHRPEAGESDDGERRRCDAAHGPGSGAQAARGAQGLMPCQGGAEPAPV